MKRLLKAQATQLRAEAGLDSRRPSVSDPWQAGPSGGLDGLVWGNGGGDENEAQEANSKGLQHADEGGSAVTASSVGDGGSGDYGASGGNGRVGDGGSISPVGSAGAGGWGGRSSAGTESWRGLGGGSAGWRRPSERPVPMDAALAAAEFRQQNIELRRRIKQLVCLHHNCEKRLGSF